MTLATADFVSLAGPQLQEVARCGFDHGVGHSLLLLCDSKAPHGEKRKEFKGLGHYLFNISVVHFK